VKKLLEKRIYIDKKGITLIRRKALHAAVRSSFKALVPLLLENGAHVMTMGSDRLAALYKAITAIRTQY
jgi:hypothetical protein